jgi:hypothetical protein
LKKSSGVFTASSSLPSSSSVDDSSFFAAQDEEVNKENIFNCKKIKE